MKLRLTVDKQTLEISNVKLQEGYMPSLSGYTYAGKIKVLDETPTEFIEPAIWFKIYLMDILHIDCDLRVIYWLPRLDSEEISIEPDKPQTVNDEETEDELMKEVVLSEDLYNESYKLGDDCVDYFNDLNEVYDVLPSMLTMYRNNKLTKEEFYKSLIGLIHANVLPNVKLSIDNLDLLKKCFHSHKKHMKDMNDIIANKTNQLSYIKSTKLRERQKFMLKINQSVREPKMFDALVDLLEKEYNKDLEKAAYEYKKSHVDYLRSLCDKTTSEHSVQLQDVVTNHKNDVINLNTVLVKINQMKNKSGFSKVLFRRNSPVGEEAIFQEMYLKMKETEDAIQKKIYGVMDKKLMILSVYENMRNVIHELIEGFESFGVDFDTKSRMKSSILAETCLSTHWKSLPELVNIILSNSDHEITKEHFLMMIKVKEILAETLQKYKDQCQSNSLLPSLIKKHFSIEDDSSTEHLKNVSNSTLSEKDNFRDSDIQDTIVERANVLGSFRNYSKSMIKRSQSLNGLNRQSTNLSIRRFKSSINLQSLHKNDYDQRKKHSINKPTFKSYLEDEAFFINRDFDYLMQTIQKVKPMLADHFKSICTKLNLEIDKTFYRQNFRKIWVIYENYFYEYILNMVLDLYKTHFSPKTEVLTEWIFKLDLDDLEMGETSTTKLLLTSNNDDLSLDLSMDSEETLEPTEKNNLLSSTNSDDKVAGSQGSLISAIIEGLTKQEDLFRECQKEKENGEQGSDYNKLKIVVKDILKTNFKKLENLKDYSDKKIVHSGFKSHECIPKNDDIPDSNPDPGIPNCPKPKIEKKYFSTSEKPLDFDVDTYISNSNFRTIKMKPKIMNRFLKAYSHLKIALSASTPLVKTHHMCRCLKEVTNQLTQLHKEADNPSYVVCNDELMDGLIIFVCNLDSKEIATELYVQLQLMTDTLADLFEAGEYRFALVMFQGVCQYLQDKTMMKKNRMMHNNKMN